MSKFYTVSTQAKELCNEVKTTKEKSKKMTNEVILKKAEVIRLTNEALSSIIIEQKLKNEVEELKVDSIEKETHITHLEVKVKRFTSSMEKAHKEAVATFMKSNKFKNHLDRHYAASSEDFRSDAKEAYPEMDFDSFKIPTTTENSLLLTSFQDVNMMDDTSTEPT